MPAGRPTKYEKRFTEEAIAFIGSGKSVTQFARHIQVSKSAVYKWADEHPEFMDALNLGRDWSQAVWEDKLETMMTDSSVNSPLVKLYFANRFKWHDKPEEHKEKTVPITIEVVNPHAKD